MSPFPFKAKCTCCHRFVSKAWIMLSKWPLSVLKCIFRQQNLFLAKKKNVANIGFFRLSPIEWHKLFRNNNQQKERLRNFWHIINSIKWYLSGASSLEKHIYFRQSSGKVSTKLYREIYPLLSVLCKLLLYRFNCYILIIFIIHYLH